MPFEMGGMTMGVPISSTLFTISSDVRRQVARGFTVFTGFGRHPNARRSAISWLTTANGKRADQGFWLRNETNDLAGNSITIVP